MSGSPVWEIALSAAGAGSGIVNAWFGNPIKKTFDRLFHKVDRRDARLADHEQRLRALEPDRDPETGRFVSRHHPVVEPATPGPADAHLAELARQQHPGGS